MNNTTNTNNFDFELVSPEEKLMSTQAWQVTIPGYEGDFGVRAGHASVVSNIRAGVVEIVTEQGAEPTQVFIAGGFADVTVTNCTILAEEAMMLKDLDQDQIEKDVADLQNKLSAANDAVETIRYTKQLDLAKAKLTAVTGLLAA